MATATDDRPITDDEIFQALEMDFEPREIHQKPNGRGGSFPYIKAPSVRRRLNQVVGRANWETKIQIVQQSAVCSLTIHLPSGRSITRCGVGHIGRNDKEDVVYKGAATDALKRAAVEFGIGASFYDDDEPEPEPQNSYSDRRGDRRSSGHNGRRDAHNGSRNSNGNGRRSNGDSQQRGDWRPPSEWTPTNGKMLWAWLGDMEKEHHNEVRRHIMQWGKNEGFGHQITQWDSSAVELAVQEAEQFCEGDD